MVISLKMVNLIDIKNFSLKIANLIKSIIEKQYLTC